MEGWQPQYLKKLLKGRGYPIDVRNAGTDKIALAYSLKHFGEEPVNKVMDKFHRAEMNFTSLEDDFKKFDRSYAPMIKRDPVYFSVLESLRKEFVPTEKIIPFTTGGAISSPDFPIDKSPGHPFRERGYKTKGDVVKDPSAMAEIMRKWYKIGDSKPAKLADTLLFYRAQICPREKNKIRAVFGYPIEVFIEESRFMLPYVDEFVFS